MLEIGVTMQCNLVLQTTEKCNSVAFTATPCNNERQLMQTEMTLMSAALK